MPRWFVPSLSFSTRSVPYFFSLEKKSLRPIESTLRKTTLDRSGAAISGIRGWFSFNIACVMKLLLYCKSFVKFQSVYFSKGNFDRSMEFLRNLFHNEANEARSHQNQCSNKTCIRSGHFSSLRARPTSYAGLNLLLPPPRSGPRAEVQAGFANTLFPVNSRQQAKSPDGEIDMTWFSAPQV